MNKHPTKWKKIFTCHIPHKGMISKLLHNNKNSTDNPIKKWAEELYRHSLKKSKMTTAI